MQTFGDLMATARVASGLSLAKLGAAMGLSVPYLHDVEHGKRRLAHARWLALGACLPALDLQALAEASLATGPVTIDAQLLTPKQRTTLARAIIVSAKGST